MNVLLTGFDPFGGEPVNPALEAVKNWMGCSWPGPGSTRWKSPQSGGRPLPE